MKSYEKFGLLIKGISKTVKNKRKEQKQGFLGMLLGALDASFSGNLLTGKGATATSQDITCLDVVQVKLIKEKLELARIFNVTSPFNTF